MISDIKGKMAEIYYWKEKLEHKESFDKKLSVKKAEMIYKKLCRHFKLSRVRLEWTSGCVRPKCSSWRVLLNVSNNNFGVLCHEVGHLYQFQKPKYKQGHNKWHKKIMKRMVDYCEKKNWFEEELDRRTKPKEPKPEPTPKELRLKKIERFEQGIKRHQTKIKRCQTLIKKNNRRISALKRFI